MQPDAASTTVAEISGGLPRQRGRRAAAPARSRIQRRGAAGGTSRRRAARQTPRTASTPPRPRRRAATAYVSGEVQLRGEHARQQQPQAEIGDDARQRARRGEPGFTRATLTRHARGAIHNCHVGCGADRRRTRQPAPGHSILPCLPVHVQRVLAVGRAGAAAVVDDAHVARERAGAGVRHGHGVDRAGAAFAAADQRTVAVVDVQVVVRRRVRRQRRRPACGRPAATAR